MAAKGNEESRMSAHPSPEILEQQAAEQRSRIHHTALELISKVDEAKQQLSLEHNVRKYFLSASIIACSLAFLSGYIFGELFASR
jgi:hypothetical protein